MSNNKFCMTCGKPLSPKDSFCTHCGTAVPKSVARFCIKCGAPLNVSDKFCAKCGAVIHQETPAPPPAPPKPKPPVMGKCRRCGAELTIGTRKCPKCGKKVKRKLTKGQIVRRVIAAVLVGTILGVTLWNRQLMPWDLLKKKHKSVELQAGQTVQPGMTVTYAETKGETAHGVDSARNTIAGTLGINAENLGNGKKTEALGDNFYRFEQTYNGIPVFGREAILAVEGSGETIGVFGNYMELSDVNTMPEVSDEEARKTLKRKLGDPLVLSAHLTIYTLRDHEPELAWQYRVMGEKFSGECLVSAETGKLLFKNSFERNIDVPAEGSGYDNEGNYRVFGTVLQDDGQYRLEDTQYQFVIYNAGQGSHTRRDYVNSADGLNHYYVEFEDDQPIAHNLDGERVEIPEGTILILSHSAFYANGQEISPMTQRGDEWTDAEAVTLMYSLQVTHDFFYEYFSLEGYDHKKPNECSMYVVFNDDLNGDPKNAYSDSFLHGDGIGLLAFGYGNPIAVDVVAHEYTHSVENCYSGMIYSGESGALMEAYSDIYGEIVEDYENDRFLNGNCDWKNYFRNIKTPLWTLNPSIYKGILWGNPEDSNDHGHVHLNSTVVSKAAYNMVRTDNAITEPLSNKQLAELFFLTMQILDPDSSFEGFAQKLMLFAHLYCAEGRMNESQLLTVHLALVRAGLMDLDYSLLGEFDIVRIVAHRMASMVPWFLLDEIGITREELEESYYLELSAFWELLKDPMMQQALRDMWRYVVYGEPLEWEFE